MTFFGTFDITSITISRTSENLFSNVAMIIASKGYSFPQYEKRKKDFIIIPLKLILATPVSAKIKTLYFSGEYHLTKTNKKV